MQVNFIVSMLKSSVLGDLVVKDGEDTIKLYDPEFNPDTKYLEDLVRVSAVRAGVKGDIEKCKHDYTYPILLHAKRDLYMKLATKAAPLYQVVSDTITLNKQQRFNHYYVLIQLIDSEINRIEESGEYNFVETSEALLDGVHYGTRRRRELMDAPEIELEVDNLVVSEEGSLIEFSWTPFNVLSYNKFDRYEIFIQKDTPVIDEYNPDELVSKTATKVREIRDNHVVKFRVKDLDTDSKYYLAVLVVDRNGLVGWSQVEFTTELDTTEEGETGDSTSTDTDDSNTSTGDGSGIDIDIGGDVQVTKTTEELNRELILNDNDEEYLYTETYEGHMAVGTEVTLRVIQDTLDEDDIYQESKIKTYEFEYNYHALDITDLNEEQVGVDEVSRISIVLSISAKEIEDSGLLEKYTVDEVVQKAELQMLSNKYTILSLAPRNVFKDTNLVYRITLRERDE